MARKIYGIYKDDLPACIGTEDEAYDYDIQNEFNQTDYVIDLFKEIRGGIITSLPYLTGSRKTI